MMDRIVRTTGGDIAVRDRGAGDQAIIFLHYWGGSARTWDYVINDLPETVRMVALNQRGWGSSLSTDGRYDLEALASDVLDIVSVLQLRRFILVGHSMGGKVAEILAGRRVLGLKGMVLVAPAPPTPMPVPADVRAAMLASYQSREGVQQAMERLIFSSLPPVVREQIVTDTLAGADGAKQSWTDKGMTQDVSAGLDGFESPVTVLVGEHDQIERESILRPLFSGLWPQTTFMTVPGAGHLLPLEAPAPIAQACMRMLADLEMLSPEEKDVSSPE